MQAWIDSLWEIRASTSPRTACKPAATCPLLSTDHHIHKLGEPRRRQLELDRTTDDVPEVVRDQHHRRSLTDVDWHHQALFRRQGSNPVHVARLANTTSELPHINLLGRNGLPTLPTGGTDPGTYYENLAPSPPSPAQMPRMSRSPLTVTPMTTYIGLFRTCPSRTLTTMASMKITG